VKILHVGCGRKQGTAEETCEAVGLKIDLTDATVYHLDADEHLSPDVVCRLGRDEINANDDFFDVILAWHVLEHIGKQGESQEWFHAFQELYRVLKPGGLLYGECPYYTSLWAWSDPTHTRAISEASFAFFNQDNYRVPHNSISPYRIHCDFKWATMPGLPKGYVVTAAPDDARITSLRFALTAKKPLEPWWVS
jgi:SAM-dependent methyltransferase